ncbi:cobalt-precorrin-6A reductase [Pseudooceanicola aestuarii]|uniref:cobalt-precorrin-6A reductase n=1 Tax=Pseudooceanicola aestuarii TaxID=2697319 RepID=UPI0013D8900A|nr:cobalt-precorrin-6A reductase [Pseudooceanicola aestuarii]
MTLLILGGTAEARALAGRLAEQGPPAILSLAGATRHPAPQGLPTRHGGFGGAAGFRDYLRAQDISAVVDATHPFAARITARTGAVCAAVGLPYCRLSRPAWEPGPGDHWTGIAAEEEAARHIPAGAHVFLATGRQGVARFANLAGRRVTCRVLDPARAPFPFAGGRYMVAHPPFTVADEAALFTLIGVDWLVVKNAGGSASRPKLDAARQLGLPVLMLRRPPDPATGARVADVAGALDWIVAQGRAPHG